MKPSPSAETPADPPTVGASDPLAAGAEDERLCELLDRYVGALQAGDEPLRQALLADHPQLADLAGCLRALDGLSRLPADPARSGTLADAAGADVDPLPAAGTQFGNTSCCSRRVAAAWAWSTKPGKPSLAGRSR